VSSKSITNNIYIPTLLEVD